MCAIEQLAFHVFLNLEYSPPRQVQSCSYNLKKVAKLEKVASKRLMFTPVKTNTIETSSQLVLPAAVCKGQPCKSMYEGSVQGSLNTEHINSLSPPPPFVAGGIRGGVGVGWTSSFVTPLLSLAGLLDHTKTSGMSMGPFARIINDHPTRVFWVCDTRLDDDSHFISNKPEWTNCFIKNAYKLWSNLSYFILLKHKNDA